MKKKRKVFLQDMQNLFSPSLFFVSLIFLKLFRISLPGINVAGRSMGLHMWFGKEMGISIAEIGTHRKGRKQKAFKYPYTNHHPLPSDPLAPCFGISALAPTQISDVVFSQTPIKKKNKSQNHDTLLCTGKRRMRKIYAREMNVKTENLCKFDRST